MDLGPMNKSNLSDEYASDVMCALSIRVLNNYCFCFAILCVADAEYI